MAGNDVLRIDEIRLQHFRCFEDAEFRLAPQFTLVVGDNASGKTALLRALVLGVGVCLADVPDADVPRMAYEDVRYRLHEVPGGAAFLEHATGADVDCVGQVYGVQSSWGNRIGVGTDDSVQVNGRTARGHTAGTPVRYTPELGFGTGDANLAGRPDELEMPVVVHYATGRLWERTVADGDAGVGPLPIGGRTQGYNGWPKAAASGDLLVRWWQRQALIAFHDSRMPPSVEAVKSAIATCVRGCTDARFDPRSDDIVFMLEDGLRQPFWMLSDGYRNMVAMAADIAIRASLLNPHLGSEAAAKTPGIVLIDEIDLHLHPKWQRTVVEDLRRTFPLVQFVATTHSPFIIQTMRPNEIIRLPDDSAPIDYSPGSVDDAIREVMGVEDHDWPPRKREMAKQAAELLRVLRKRDGITAEDEQLVTERLDELLSLYSSDPAYCAMLQVEAEAFRLRSQAGATR